MSDASDIALIESQPPFRIWGKDLVDIDDHKVYKGKFVITSADQFFCELMPKEEWDQTEFYHDMVVEHLGVQEPESLEVKELVIGGGRIQVELLDGHAEVRLWGKSSIYGDYEADNIDTERLGREVQDAFGLDELPVTVDPEFEE